MLGNAILRCLFVCAVAMACLACGAAAEVHSVRDPHYQGRIKSLYMAIGQGGIDEDYAVEFERSMKRELANRGVTVTSRIIVGVELDENLLDREVAASRAEGVLIVQPVRGTESYGELINITYDVNLFEAHTRGRIWRARVDTRRAGGAWGTTAGMVDELAVSLAAKLESDHLLGG